MNGEKSCPVKVQKFTHTNLINTVLRGITVWGEWCHINTIIWESVPRKRLYWWLWVGECVVLEWEGNEEVVLTPKFSKHCCVVEVRFVYTCELPVMWHYFLVGFFLEFVIVLISPLLSLWSFYFLYDSSTFLMILLPHTRRFVERFVHGRLGTKLYSYCL